MKNELTILLYHGVTASVSRGIENFSGKHITADAFEKQMKYIKMNCNLMSIDDIVEFKIEEKDYPENAVAVSFDDGFENNHSVAAPILKKYQIPSVFYISTGFISANRMFWVDQIEDTINRAENRSISIDGIGDFDLKSYDDKLSALVKIKKNCKIVSSEKKNEIISNLISQTGTEPNSSASDNYKTMSWSQVKDLACNPLFTIGGHTVNHEILTKLDHAKMRYEAFSSIKTVNDRLGQTCRHFSYPEGQADHYSDGVISTLKEAGVVCSPSAINGINTTEDLFNLKRVMVGFMGTPAPKIFLS